MSRYCRATAICSHQVASRLSGHQNALAPLYSSLMEMNFTQTLDLKRHKYTFAKPIALDAKIIGGSSHHPDGSLTLRKEEPRSATQQQENMFGDYNLAYRTKSTWELMRALGCFFMCRFPSFADNAEKIMELSYSMLGKRVSNFLIGRTVYDQFVAGQTIGEMSETITKLRRGNVGPILCCPTESYTEESGMTKDEFFDLNLAKVLDSIDQAMNLEDRYPMVQYKFTAFIGADLVTAIGPLCLKTLHNPEVIEGIMAAMNGQDVDFNKLPGWQTFPSEKSAEFLAGLQRIGKINRELEKHDIIALTDAEYTSMNPALRLIGLASMKQCNTGHRAKVFHTYQAYLKTKAAELAEDIQFAKTSGFSLGVKLVRGAYMIQERQRAKEGGYPDPVNDDYEATCRSYGSCLDLLLKEAAGASASEKEGSRPSVRFIIASHNEDSVLYALQRMKDLEVPKDGGNVFFGQLYGMADHVSFVLGTGGYYAYKSMPYGSINDTLPYLARRAQENKAIFTNARRERKLIFKTLKDRALLRG